jgi:preprotein translocase subunit SecB
VSEQDQNTRRFELQRIYLKDTSFESPNAPQMFLEDWKPQIDLQLGTETRGLDDGVFEVTLKVTVTNRVNDKTAFLVEVAQAGIFIVQGFGEQELTHMLGSYCPNILLPYAREAISDLVVKGSFPQYLLPPVNFDALLNQHLQQVAAEQGDSQGADEDQAQSQSQPTTH